MTKHLMLLVAVVIVVAAASAVDVPPHPTTSTNSRCQDCHTPDGWLPARFDHDKTGFALNGRHVDVACASCHDADFRQQAPTSCAGCHRDVHGQEFGAQCRGCHDERSFQPLFAVDAHRKTNFPLVGRHAAVRCEQCHIEQRERGFTRVTLPCTACHAAAAARASTTTVNHRGLTECRECHVPLAFSPARLPAHEVCYPIARGAHAAVRCAECHGGIAGRVVAGGCDTMAVRCAECHEHRAQVTDVLHRAVDGYAHRSARCLSCHRPL